jgi:hypothetical protein
MTKYWRLRPSCLVLNQTNIDGGNNNNKLVSTSSLQFFSLTERLGSMCCNFCIQLETTLSASCSRVGAVLGFLVRLKSRSSLHPFGNSIC